MAGLTKEQKVAKEAAAKSAQSLDAADIAYVDMVRDPKLNSGPHMAQVHPDEVENYRPGGWMEA